jgi:hypothetical protein
MSTNWQRKHTSEARCNRFQQISLSKYNAVLLSPRGALDFGNNNNNKNRQIIIPPASNQHLVREAAAHEGHHGIHDVRAEVEVGAGDKQLGQAARGRHRGGLGARRADGLLRAALWRSVGL